MPRRDRRFPTAARIANDGRGDLSAEGARLERRRSGRACAPGRADGRRPRAAGRERPVRSCAPLSRGAGGRAGDARRAAHARRRAMGTGRSRRRVAPDRAGVRAARPLSRDRDEPRDAAARTRAPGEDRRRAAGGRGVAGSVDAARLPCACGSRARVGGGGRSAPPDRRDRRSRRRRRLDRHSADARPRPVGSDVVDRRRGGARRCVESRASPSSRARRIPVRGGARPRRRRPRRPHGLARARDAEPRRRDRRARARRRLAHRSFRARPRRDHPAGCGLPDVGAGRALRCRRPGTP